MLKSLVTIGCLALLSGTATAQHPTDTAVKITVNWTAERNPLKTTPTLQVVVNPLLRRGAPIHDAAFANLERLGADYVRFVPWHPYPRLAVAELEPPTKDKTSWDFSLIDPLTIDFLNATEGHDRILNFSTIPAWMYHAKTPVTVPTDPDRVYWDYTQGKQLRDLTCRELAGYYSRLIRWYTQGGFTDELGVRHESGYHYKIPYWEVFNEIDVEHQPTPEQYTASYDAIVGELHQIDPAMKFVGLALAFPERNPEMMEYFLDHRNHKSGIPLDMISYHFYASPTKEQTPDNWQYSFFDQADGFLTAVRYIETIRKRLSPRTGTDADELGIISADDLSQNDPGHVTKPIAPAYWNLAGSLYAYLFIGLARQQVDIIGESQLVGYPTQFPSVSMMDWEDNRPNARFWVLKLIRDSFHPGDTLVETALAGSGAEALEAQAFITAAGRRLLLVNKRDRAVDVALPDAGKAAALTVDAGSGGGPARVASVAGATVRLEAFAVTVVSW